MSLDTRSHPDPSPNAPAKPKRVGDLLLDKGLITEEQIEQALAFQSKREDKRLLGQVLVDLGFVTDEQVLESLAETQGLHYTRLNPRRHDPTLLEILPRDFCDEKTVLPLFLVNGELALACAEPENVFLLDEVQQLTGHRVRPIVTPAKDIKTLLHHDLSGERVNVLNEVMQSIDEADVAVIETDLADLQDEDIANDSPVIKLVNYIISEAVREGASDIHIEPDEAQLRVRYRVDGRLFEKLSPPPRLQPAIASRVKIMAGLDISERRIPQDGGITLAFEGRQVELRVSTMPAKFGEKVVMRIADTRNAVTRLDDLGFSPEMLGEFRNLIAQPNGVVLVTGPTGSGKSTTLYGSLAEINREDINISTVEDPVEFNIRGINQFQVKSRAGFSFAKALRALLRQDPDVVMLGEIRDEETARIATQAALTGHLVLSTLHTNDSVSAITRLINIGIEPYLVAAAVRGVLAQRLVRRLCPHCKEPCPVSHYQDDPSVRPLMGSMAGLETVYKAVGCKHCRNTGYKGRLGIYELYRPGDACLDAINSNPGLQALRSIATDHARYYTTLMDDGMQKIAQGLTTPTELIRATAV